MFDEPPFIDDWVRERVLGTGGFGIVTLWKNSITDDAFAIKKFRGELDKNLSTKQKDRWKKEVEMMQKIDCINIVKYKSLPENFKTKLENYNPTHLPMLSMEYCTQGDLRIVLSRGENCCGLPESDVRYILADLMNAVSYLHNLKITHRDLKPENVVLQTYDRPNHIIYKLIDLGYAKEIDASSVQASFVGTLQYLAPEIFYSKSYSCSVDYWSLGLVAFEVICGIRPFLPNMSPAQWIKLVKEKKSDDICIFQKENGEITYQNELYSENHISSCFKQEIERWLQIALEFDPKKRGYIKSDKDVVIFKALEKILNKKIVTVYCAYVYKFYSYEIDDFTLITTLQGWIERDTKINKSDQFLLSYNCTDVKTDVLAVQYFDESYLAVPMMYVFKKSIILKEDIQPEIPNLVKIMLENSPELPYHFQKLYYAQSLYFTFKETKLYNTVLDACNLRVKYILKLSNDMRDKCNKMMSNIQMLIAQKELSKEILDFDVKQYLKLFSQDATHWIKSHADIAHEIDKLNELSLRLVVRFDSATRRIDGIHQESEKVFSKYSDHKLNEMLNEALQTYNAVKSRSKDQRYKSESCIKMIKVLYNVLINREKLLKDKLFIQYHQKIMDIQYEFEKMYIPVNTAISHAEKFKSNLFSDQITRQTKIWEFTIKPKPKKLEQTPVLTKKETPKTQFIIGNTKIPIYEHGDQISLEKPLHFILGDTSSIDSNCSYHSLSQSPTKTSLQNISENIEPKLKDEEKNKEDVTDKTVTVDEDYKNISPHFQIGGLTSIINNALNSNLHLNNENKPLNETEFEEKKTPGNTENLINENKSIETTQNVFTSMNKNDINKHRENIIPNFEKKNFFEENVKILDNKTDAEYNENIDKSNLKTNLESLSLIPNFKIGAPAMDIINDNKTLRYELQEKTNESFLKCKSILNENLDFSFLEENL